MIHDEYWLMGACHFVKSCKLQMAILMAVRAFVGLSSNVKAYFFDSGAQTIVLLWPNRIVAKPHGISNLDLCLYLRVSWLWERHLGPTAQIHGLVQSWLSWRSSWSCPQWHSALRNIKCNRGSPLGDGERLFGRVFLLYLGDVAFLVLLGLGERDLDLLLPRRTGDNLLVRRTGERLLLPE